MPQTGGKHPRAGDAGLDRDARDLQEAVSELVRVYQFRDRKRICYYDISVTQCHALSELVAHGPMTLNALAGHLYLDKSTVSRLLDSLEDKSYVSRAADRADARALKLRLTRQGRALHGRIVRDLVEETKQLAADFDPDVRQATTRLIARFARAATARFADGKVKGGKG